MTTVWPACGKLMPSPGVIVVFVTPMVGMELCSRVGEGMRVISGHSIRQQCSYTYLTVTFLLTMKTDISDTLTVLQSLVSLVLA